MSPKPYEVWTSLDLEYLYRCDAVLRLPGGSPGADAEVAVAVDRAIPVFHSETMLRAWIEADRP